MAVRFTRGRRRTGISARDIVLRHLDFGHLYIDRQAGVGLPAVAADTNHPRAEVDLLAAAAADTNRLLVGAGHPAVAADINRLPTASSLLETVTETDRLRTMAVNLPAVAEANHLPATTEAGGLPAITPAQDLPAMAGLLGRPHNRRRVPPVPPPAILTLVFHKAANRPSDPRRNRIRALVPEALTAASAESPSERRAIAAKQAPGAAIAQGGNSDETA
jgi:hypothetical protein